MTKIVPDPPLPNTPRKPAYTSFGCCHGDHPPLFSVREDIKLEDALVYLSIMIQCVDFAIR